jgi:hypothetical protein
MIFLGSSMVCNDLPPPLPSYPDSGKSVVTGNYFVLILTWANRAEAGKVVLVRGPWINEFLAEVNLFPNGRHDDQVDAVSLAVQMIEARKRVLHVF